MVVVNLHKTLRKEAVVILVVLVYLHKTLRKEAVVILVVAVMHTRHSESKLKKQRLFW